MPISYCICTKISQAGDIQRNQSRCRENSEKIMQPKGSRNIEAELCPDHVHNIAFRK